MAAAESELSLSLRDECALTETAFAQCTTLALLLKERLLQWHSPEELTGAILNFRPVLCRDALPRKLVGEAALYVPSCTTPTLICIVATDVITLDDEATTLITSAVAARSGRTPRTLLLEASTGMLFQYNETDSEHLIWAATRYWLSNGEDAEDAPRT